VRSSLAKLLAEEEQDLFSDVESRLGIKLELSVDDTLSPSEYNIL
jgi:hypothetical protein